MSRNSGEPSSSRSSFSFDGVGSQIRALSHQYIPSGPPEVRNLQALITANKAVCVDFEGIGKDSQVLGSRLSAWGQNKEDDVKNVTDHLVSAHNMMGALSSNLVTVLEDARKHLKKLQEANLVVASTKSDLDKVSKKDKGLQQTRASIHDIAVREAFDRVSPCLKESETLKWGGIQEYAEKLGLISQAAILLLEQLPSSELKDKPPYGDTRETELTMTALQDAIEMWKPGMTLLSRPPKTKERNIDQEGSGGAHDSLLFGIPSFPDVDQADPRSDIQSQGADQLENPIVDPDQPNYSHQSWIDPAGLDSSPITDSITLHSPSTTYAPRTLKDESSSVPLFSGGSGKECEDFIHSIMKQAREEGKDDDDKWMLQVLRSRLNGKALRWFVKLDKGVRTEWDPVVHAILAEYE